MRLDIPVGQVQDTRIVIPPSGRQPSPASGRPSVLLAAESTIIDTDHARVGAWMHDHGAGRYRDGSTCIGLERHGELVAGTLYDYFNGASIFANIAITGPITRAWLWFIFYYPFVQLGAKVIIGLVSQDNRRSLKFVKKLGFQTKTCLVDADPSGWLNIVTLHRRDCRFLRRPYEA